MMARFPVGEFPGGRAAAAPPARSVPDKPPLHYIRREGGASLPEGRGGGFQTVILLSIGSLRFFGLDRVFMVAKDLGFDGVEVIVDDRWDTTDAGYLRLLSERYALPIPSLHSPFSFIKPPAWGNDQVEHMRRSVKLAEDIGSELLVIHLAFFADRRYAGWVRNDLPRWQERTRVKLAVENMPHAFKILGGAGIRLGTGTFYAVDRGRLRNRLLRPFSRDCHIDNTFENLRRYRWRVLDTVKRERIRRCASLDDDLPPAECCSADRPDDAAYASEFARQLAPTQRRVLDCLLRGLTFRQAGETLGCASANIAYHVRKIRRCYEEWSL